MKRINVPLDQNELMALIDMARTDCRHPREQMRYLLRAEAERRGVLPAPTSTECEPSARYHEKTVR